VILGVHVSRQLWIQLRLLAMITLPVVVSVIAVTVEGQVGSAELGRVTLAIGFGVVAIVEGALVGTGFSEEIRSGAAAWLVVRAVPRTALIGAWLVVPALVVVAAYGLAGILAGLAIPPPGTGNPDPLTITIGILASAAPVIPLSAIALAIAVTAPGRTTGVATVGIGAGLAVMLLLVGSAVIHPASGYWLVAGAAPAARPITVGLSAIGLCLAVAAVAWLLAARRFAQRDL
jgi:hypothetical protein